MTPAQAIRATASEVLRWTSQKKTARAPVTMEACTRYVRDIADGLSIGKSIDDGPLRRKTTATYLRYLGNDVMRGLKELNEG